MIYAVIGSNFGDEGKGYEVNKLCEMISSKEDDTVVIRTNGGSQAGHTVKLNDKINHVFHHFGSGTLQLVRTYLSEEFIVNPIVFRDEYKDLQILGNYPLKLGNAVEYVNSNARITTPYDMIINQALETVRDKDRHGSCGLGINETIVRNEDKTFSFKVKDIVGRDVEFISYILNQIKNEYVPKRLKDLNIYDKIDDRTSYYLIDEDNTILNRYIEDTLFFISNVKVKEYDFLNNFNNLIFENAQGLLLDKDNKEYYPHVTPTKTGLRYIIDILKALKLTDNTLNVIYVSRPYLTRHGAGTLINELKDKSELNMNIKEDTTNIQNEWQGTLRYAPLNIVSLTDRIKEDIHSVSKDISDLNLTLNVDIHMPCCTLSF